MKQFISIRLYAFQSTPSVWRETCRAEGGIYGDYNFNPLPPCGGRRHSAHSSVLQDIFQSTPSVWRETHSTGSHCHYCVNFNPLPPCGGRRIACIALVDSECISIHSLRVEGDQKIKGLDVCSLPHFNPLPPCGGRQYRYIDTLSVTDFNPLPPCGGRPFCLYRTNKKVNFNPLPPCGGRRKYINLWRAKLVISIHSLRVEGDDKDKTARSTVAISIHSLRVEGDSMSTPEFP